MTTSYMQHLPKIILGCLLTIPCHSAQDDHNRIIHLNVQTLAKKIVGIDIAPSATILDVKQKFYE